MPTQRAETGSHIRFGDPEAHLPVDTDEQIAAAKRAMSDAGVHCASVWKANGYCAGRIIWADEATWRGWTIIRDGGRRFIERGSERVAADPGLLGDVRCQIDRIEDAREDA